MPLILDRRSFLRRSAIGAAGASLGNWSFAQSPSTVRFALLSDTHISRNAFDRFRGFSPHENLAKCINQMGDLKFELLLVNGDLARQQGDVLDYLQFNSFIEPLTKRTPVLLTLGNHDHRINARATLFDHAGTRQAVEDRLVSTVETAPVLFIFLDSLLTTNVPEGQLGDKQRQWLANYLDDKTGKPTVVFVHHNPASEALLDTEKLLEILTPRSSVKALIFGHQHVYHFDERNKLHLINLPATSYNFADGNPVGWVQATFDSTGAAFVLHAVAGESGGDGKTTKLAWR